MGKRIFLFLLVAMTFSLVGCFGPAEKTKAPDYLLDFDSVGENQNSNEGAGAPVGGEFKRFYPEDGGSLISDSPPLNETKSAGGFVLTQDLQVKIHLIDKYQPGICYGLPAPVPAEAIKGMIDRQPGLAEFVRQRYQLKTDLEVYNKIKQINGVGLKSTASGKYQFDFMDGQCCVLNYYEGEAMVIGQTVSDVITSRSTKENPC